MRGIQWPGVSTWLSARGLLVQDLLMPVAGKISPVHPATIRQNGYLKYGKIKMVEGEVWAPLSTCHTLDMLLYWLLCYNLYCDTVNYLSLPLSC